MTRRLIAGDGYVNSLINHCSECHKVFHPVAIVSGVIAAVPGNESRIAGRTDVHPGHSLNQIQISNGTMLDSVSGFRSWVCPEGMLITLHHEFYRQITHCMCRCLTVRIINLPDIFTNFLPFPGEYPRHVRVMAVRFLVAQDGPLVPPSIMNLLEPSLQYSLPSPVSRPKANKCSFSSMAKCFP